MQKTFFLVVSVTLLFVSSGCAKINSALEQARKGGGTTNSPTPPSAQPGVVKQIGTIIDGGGSQVYSTNSYKVSGVSVGGLTRQIKATSTSFMVQGGLHGR